MKQQEGVDWFQAKHEGEGSLLIEFIRGGPGFQRASIDQGHPLIFDGETIAALTAEGYLRLHVAARSNTLVTFELKDLEYLGQFHEAACPHSDHLIDREAQDPDSDDYVGWQHDCREEILQRPVSIIRKRYCPGI